MKTLFKMIFIIALLCIITSCATVEGLYVDSSFTYKSIGSQNIGVGGVTSAVHSVTRGQQLAFANLLRSGLIENYPGLEVMPAGDAVRALGASRYNRMMNYYRQYGVIQSQYLQALRRHIHHIRYLAFARIVEDRIMHHRNQYQDQDNLSHIHFTTDLDLRVNLVVYDLVSGRIVWSGSTQEERSTSNSYNVPGYATDNHHGYKKEVVQDLASIVGNEMVAQHHSYPSSPSFNGLLQSIFGVLVKKFPKGVKT